MSYSDVMGLMFGASPPTPAAAPPMMLQQQQRFLSRAMPSSDSANLASASARFVMDDVGSSVAHSSSQAKLVAAGASGGQQVAASTGWLPSQQSVVGGPDARVADLLGSTTAAEGSSATVTPEDDLLTESAGSGSKLVMDAEGKVFYVNI